MPVRKFLDTSAEVKLYVTEPATPAVQAAVTDCDEVLISQLTLLDFPSALYGMVRERRKTQAEAAMVVRLFDADLPNVTVIPADKDVYQRAVTLLEIYAVSDKLRPLDSLQLATALEEHARNPIDAIVTTDTVQRLIAAANGLRVEP